MNMIKRLAQIAEELEQDGMPNEALMLDNAIEPLQSPQTDIQQPKEAPRSVIDTIAEYVHDVMSNLPASPEAIIDPANRTYVNHAIDNAAI